MALMIIKLDTSVENIFILLFFHSHSISKFPPRQSHSVVFIWSTQQLESFKLEFMAIKEVDGNKKEQKKNFPTTTTFFSVLLFLLKFECSLSSFFMRDK